jgi:hypothetical protein
VFERAKYFIPWTSRLATVISIRFISAMIFVIEFGYLRLFGEKRGSRIEGQMKSAVLRK